MARIPSTSINRSWNILKRSFLHGHPHEVWGYYIACYYTTAIVQSFRSLADNALETSWRHRINPNERRRHVKEALWSQQQLLGVVVWTQQNEKQLAQTLWMRRESEIEKQWKYKRPLRDQAQSTCHLVYTATICVTWARQRSFSGAVRDVLDK